MTIYLNERALGFLNIRYGTKTAVNRDRESVAKALAFVQQYEKASNIRTLFACSSQLVLTPEPTPGYFYVKAEEPEYAYGLLTPYPNSLRA